MKDVSTLTVFLISWIAFFTIIYSILGVEFDKADYADLNMITVVGIQTYRNSIGDIGPPSYPKWDKLINSVDATVSKGRQ